MEQKTKYIIFGLIGVSVIFVFLFIQTLTAKQALTRERDDLVRENSSLSAKVDKLDSSLREYENKLSSVSRELDRVSTEKNEVQRKYDLLGKVNEELTDKIKELKAKQQAVPASEGLPQNTDAYWAGILKSKTDLEIQIDALRRDLRSAQISNEQVQREKSSLEFDIKSLKAEQEDLKRQMEYNQKLMDSIAQELVREKNDKMEIEKSSKASRSENEALLRQLKGVNERKISLENKMQQLQDEKSSLEGKFGGMETMLRDKISQIGSLNEQLSAATLSGKGEAGQQKNHSVELPPIVIKPQLAASGPGKEAFSVATIGRVLAVNRDSNFVVVDLGEDAGLKAGDVLQVYKNDKPVATVEVIQVRKNISACDIKKEMSTVSIGDEVR